MSKGKYWLGLDGLDHGVWMMLVMVIASAVSAYFFNNILQILIVLAITGVVGALFFYLTERFQESKMTTRKPVMDWRKWSTARMADMAYPFLSIFSSVGTILVIFLVWKYK